jgi:hypothetical protein
MSAFNIEVESGTSVKLPTAGKYCDRDIVVTATGGSGGGYTQEEMDKAVSDAIEDGKQAEYDRFWDAYQQNGNRTDYYNRFTQDGWNDTTFNPKYPITCKGTSTAACAFTRLGATRIPVPVIIEGIQARETFYYATNLKTIDKLVLNGVTSFSSCFTGCSKLENITIEGSIDVSFNLSASAVLTAESAKNIIDHLTDYLFSDNEGVYSFKLHDNVWAALDATYPVPENSVGMEITTWKEYVQYQYGWSV